MDRKWRHHKQNEIWMKSLIEKSSKLWDIRIKRINELGSKHSLIKHKDANLHFLLREWKKHHIKINDSNEIDLKGVEHKYESQ